MALHPENISYSFSKLKRSSKSSLVVEKILFKYNFLEFGKEALHSCLAQQLRLHHVWWPDIAKPQAVKVLIKAEL